MPHNPWTEIPYEDYEAHMSDPGVGQLKVLGEITRQALRKYLPGSFALLGACTGNGLEHVDAGITRQVWCVDINPDYLQVISDRFAPQLPGLHLICADLESQLPDIRNADLIMAALLLEYVDPARLLEAIAQMLAPRAMAVVVIQQSLSGHFVSPTSYASLQPLGSFSREVEEEKLVDLAASKHLVPVARQEMMPAKGKKFIVIDLRKEGAGIRC